MRSVRQFEAGGELVIESVPLPEPGPGEVLVKMAASPINPSDLALISGKSPVQAWPQTPGLEGSGTVVKAGRGILPSLRMGRRVACFPNTGDGGTWAEYMKTSATRTVTLPGKISMEQGAMMLVNPMTAMAFIHLARRGGHRAIVNNAAASNLGRMLIRLAGLYAIPVISIVRKEAQVLELREMGASYVLNSTAPGYEAELRKLSGELGATLILDAITGEGTQQLLNAAPDHATLVAYARLSGEPLRADPADLILHGKKIEGFQLGKWLITKSLFFKLGFIQKVRHQIPTTLGSRISRTFPLEKVNDAISLYRADMSGGKILLVHD
jgi:NADPH:quinone reductase-like Zn-dependent oxidoreductase